MNGGFSRSDIGRRAVLPALGAGAVGAAALVSQAGAALAHPDPELIQIARFQQYPFVDVTGHGAVAGTGNPPARRTAMQNAINAAISGGSRRVFVPPGLWLIDQSLQLPSGITIFGVLGRGTDPAEPGVTTEIKIENANQPALRNADETAGNDSITIRDLRVMAPQASGSAISFRATSGNCEHILIENVQVWRGGSVGIDWQNVLLSCIRGCQLGGNGDVPTGIRLVNSPDNWILHNIVASHRSAGPALHIGANSGATVVANNGGFEWSAQGILCESDRVTITGNMLRQNLREGILVNNVAGCTVTGNTFYNNGRGGTTVPATQRAGIRLVGASCRGNTVTGNTHSKWLDPQQANYQQWGVVLDSNVHHNAVVGNACADMEAGSVSVHASASNNQVVANTHG